MRWPAAMRPLVSTPWIWSKGCSGGGGVGMTRRVFALEPEDSVLGNLVLGNLVLGSLVLGNLGFGNLLSADLNEVGVAVEAEGFAAGGGDVEGSPCGSEEESDPGLAYGLEAGEAIGDLSAELRLGGFGGLGWGGIDVALGAYGEAGPVGAGGFRGQARA